MKHARRVIRHALATLAGAVVALLAAEPLPAPSAGAQARTAAYTTAPDADRCAPLDGTAVYAAL